MQWAAASIYDHAQGAPDHTQTTTATRTTHADIKAVQGLQVDLSRLSHGYLEQFQRALFNVQAGLPATGVGHAQAQNRRAGTSFAYRGDDRTEGEKSVGFQYLNHQ